LTSFNKQFFKLGVNAMSALKETYLIVIVSLQLA